MKFPSYKSIPINTLKPYTKNARTHSAEQLAQIQASITEFGFTNPLLIDENHQIIAGHGRLEAAKALKFDKVPVIVLEGLTENQKKAYVIADNKLALNAGWDDDLLKSELSELLDDDFDLSLTGFSDDELDGLLSLSESDGLTDAEAVPETPENPKTQIGDVWLLGNHRICCGDSTSADNVSQLLNGVSPHLMVTDPPYGVEYDPSWRKEAGVSNNEKKMGKVENDDRADWREAWALFPGTVAYVWHAGRFTGLVGESLEACDFQLRSQIIWAKERFALSRGHYHWQHEPCWYCVKGNANWNGDRSQSTLWKINSRDDDGHGHGTQKPIECMARPILNNSSPGQAIYEPFSGSGTTIMACEINGRCCYAMELNPAYVDVAVKRWQDFTGKQAIRERDQVYFNDVEKTTL